MNDHSMEGSAKFIKGENKVNLLARIDLVDLLRILKWFSSSAYLLISNFSAFNFVMLQNSRAFKVENIKLRGN